MFSTENKSKEAKQHAELCLQQQFSPDGTITNE